MVGVGAIFVATAECAAGNLHLGMSDDGCHLVFLAIVVHIGRVSHAFATTVYTISDDGFDDSVAAVAVSHGQRRIAQHPSSTARGVIEDAVSCMILFQHIEHVVAIATTAGKDTSDDGATSYGHARIARHFAFQAAAVHIAAS